VRGGGLEPPSLLIGNENLAIRLQSLDWGLYTGIALFGSIGSGKTYGLILPAMRQLFAYKADDPDRKLYDIVLEVKGGLCLQLQRILKWRGREQDYVEVSLDGNIRYNSLNNSLGPYAQVFNIASIITSIWGKVRSRSCSSPIQTS
jgi:hypothetical protein